eukprot:m.81259 g.81259  ORF g.81259 m.81259 type:complete len:89 (-) comp12051_c0_seq9:588-854(-)
MMTLLLVKNRDKDLLANANGNNMFDSATTKEAFIGLTVPSSKGEQKESCIDYPANSHHNSTLSPIKSYDTIPVALQRSASRLSKCSNV